MHPATLAVSWVMSNPAITAPIIGAINLEQLEYSLAAIDVNMSPEAQLESQRKLPLLRRMTKVLK